jgi:hypothetical protein
VTFASNRSSAVLTIIIGIAAAIPLACATPHPASAQMKTWDGKHPIDRIDATIAYFVPSDRTPLFDWRERVEYYADRLSRFHQREFQGQSELRIEVIPEPMVSRSSTAQLRRGDADAIFFRTLQEADRRLDFDRREKRGFPILIVLSDINWRPLDDFSRLAPIASGANPVGATKANPDRASHDDDDNRGPLSDFRFEGSLAPDGVHVPGAASGGARATYLADPGKGWGLVSGDGWRVPCRGSDCVVYHEGLGHTVGLPHPEPADASVMGLGQYESSLNRSFITLSQKRKLGWEPKPDAATGATDRLFDLAWATPEPTVPKPGQAVTLRLDIPDDIPISDCVVELQTSLRSAWAKVDVAPEDLRKLQIPIGSFDRPAPVAYRVTLRGPEKNDAPTSPPTRLWGYFQVRIDPSTPPPPGEIDPNDRPHGIFKDSHVEAQSTTEPSAEPIDLLSQVDPRSHAVSGNWTLRKGDADGGPVLTAPKAYGARIELPHELPDAYRLTVIAEPLDEPNGLILGQASGDRRFVVLLGYALGNRTLSAIENIDGKNVEANDTRTEAAVFVKNRPSQIVITVRRRNDQTTVRATVDGRDRIDWQGPTASLSLGDYWKTPGDLTPFLGAYDCRYRFTRVTLEPL